MDFGMFLGYRKPALMIILGCLLALGMAFSITSFDTAGKCYVTPCITDEMAAMYKVNTGQSFQVLLSGFLFILQPVYGLWFLRVKCTEIVAGGYISGSIFTTLLALISAVLWSSEAGMIASIIQYERDGHTIMTDESLHPTFVALSTIASLILVFGSLCCALLCVSKEYYCDEEGIGSSELAGQQTRKLKNYSYQGVSIEEDTELDDREDI